MPFLPLQDLGLYGSLLRIQRGQPVNYFLVFNLIDRGLVQDARRPRLTDEGCRVLAELQDAPRAPVT